MLFKFQFHYDYIDAFNLPLTVVSGAIVVESSLLQHSITLKEQIKNKKIELIMSVHLLFVLIILRLGTGILLTIDNL